MATKKKAKRKAPAKHKAPAKRKSTTPRKPPGFTPGNQLWRLIKNVGRKRLYNNGDELWAACVEYFEWVEANPLQEEKLFSYEGKVHTGIINKMRAMTLQGLQIFLDISAETWSDWRKNREDLKETVARVERVVYEYKFTGAAADLLNPVIIARDLGLRDGMEHTGKDGGPISGVLAVPTSPEDWVAIAKLQQASLKQDDGG